MMNIKFEDSNLFNFGTELETKVKKAAAEQEGEWKEYENEILKKKLIQI